MATNSALSTLIELATKQSDLHAQELGKAMTQVDKERAKMSALQQYQDDYAAMLENHMQSGMTPTAYHNFRQFLEKLNNAVLHQQQEINKAEAKVKKEREAWQLSERKRISYDTLVKRGEKAALMKEAKRDQKMSDEQAARIYQYDRDNG